MNFLSATIDVCIGVAHGKPPPVGTPSSLMEQCRGFVRPFHECRSLGEVVVQQALPVAHSVLKYLAMGDIDRLQLASTEAIENAEYIDGSGDRDHSYAVVDAAMCPSSPLAILETSRQERDVADLVDASKGETVRISRVLGGDRERERIGLDTAARHRGS